MLYKGLLHHFCMKTEHSHQKMRKHVRVLAQGTFDVLHAGHLHYLQFAKRQGDELIVIIARDKIVKHVKGHVPMLHEKVRREMVGALRVVDEAVLGGKRNILDKVEEINPNVIVLGYDQRISIPKLKSDLIERGISCKIIRAPAYKEKMFKSSLLKKKAAAHYQKTST